MLTLLYQFLGAAAVAVLGLLAPFFPGLRRGLGERLGLRAGPAGPGPGVGARAETIWVHAASVGEVRAAGPLVEALLRERPGAQLVVSTFTASGRRIAERTLAAGEPRVRCRYAPLDWWGSPRRALRRERPSLFVVLETELWPGLLRALGNEGVPVLIANGRISPRSFGRYRALRRALRPALGAVTLALARTPGDARRFVEIGLDPGCVRVAGNLKHARRDAAGERRREEIRRLLGAGRPVLVAGSVRGPETRLVLEAFRRLVAQEPALLLVLAPRHPERFDSAPLGAWPGAWVRWSSGREPVPPGAAVVLLDTIGELEDFYAAAAVALVGGTWADCGGHNLLEPAHYGVPVVFGPDYRHFDEEGRALLAAGGGFLAAGGEQLFEHCSRLVADPALRAAAGLHARAVARSFEGAVERTLEAARDLLGETRGRPT